MRSWHLFVRWVLGFITGEEKRGGEGREELCFYSWPWDYIERCRSFDKLVEKRKMFLIVSGECTYSIWIRASFTK